ncbi:MAG: nicotinate-nucleotide--dimethylbenzimidazole phosphoribosyltransferase [Hyphomicrobiaceae bacterium]
MSQKPFDFDVEPPALDAPRSTAIARQALLTKPLRSLGRLEDVAVEVAAIQNTHNPAFAAVAAIVFAADHGVAARGVSAYPQAVTAQMVANFLAGGAAISVMARNVGLALEVVDVGVARACEGERTISTAGAVPSAAGTRFTIDKSAKGTRDFTVGPAMTEAEREAAFHAGAAAVGRALAACHPGSLHGLVLGDMGIGNTSSATAIAAALLGREADELTGPGTGLDARGIARKASLIRSAIAKHALNASSDVRRVIVSVGGFEIAAMMGAMVEAARHRIVIVVDGYIAGVAMRAAARLCPAVRDVAIFSHRSAEPGHDAVLRALNAQPLLDLGMRLGEGSGAAVAVPLIRLACALHCDMATFTDAGVSTEGNRT